MQLNEFGIKGLCRNCQYDEREAKNGLCFAL